MEDIVSRFLQLSHTDPVYFITIVVDVLAIFLWGRLKRGLTDSERGLYRAVILVAMALSAATLSKFFGLINDWKELRSIMSSWLPFR